MGSLSKHIHAVAKYSICFDDRGMKDVVLVVLDSYDVVSVSSLDTSYVNCLCENKFHVV